MLDIIPRKVKLAAAFAGIAATAGVLGGCSAHADIRGGNAAGWLVAGTLLGVGLANAFNHNSDAPGSLESGDKYILVCDGHTICDRDHDFAWAHASDLRLCDYTHADGSRYGRMRDGQLASAPAYVCYINS